jgi:hypothetical protein
VTDFHGHTKLIKAGRKRYLCTSCQTYIEVGESRKSVFGVYYGDTYQNDHHLECLAAEAELAQTFDCNGEDWPWLHGISDDFCADEMWGIVRQNHPLAWARIMPSIGGDGA